MEENDLTKLKEKYENVDVNVIGERLNTLIEVLEQNFKRLNENLTTLAISLERMRKVGEVGKSFEKVNKSVENVKKKTNELARVITTANGTYVKLYRTVDSYYIVYKTILKQLTRFGDGLEAAVMQLRNFNVAEVLLLS